MKIWQCLSGSLPTYTQHVPCTNKDVSVQVLQKKTVLPTLSVFCNPSFEEDIEQAKNTLKCTSSIMRVEGKVKQELPAKKAGTLLLRLELLRIPGSKHKRFSGEKAQG